MLSAACRSFGTAAPSDHPSSPIGVHTPAMTRSRQPRQLKHLVNGFTLVELMVTIAILALLVSLAVPSFRNMVARYQTSSMADQLVQILSLARSEALMRSGGVVLAKQPNGSSINTCATNQEWSCGVFLWADTNRNGAQDADEPTLRTFDVPQGVVLRNMSAGSGPSITFNRWGQANGINALNFRLRQSSVSAADRSVCVSSGGRLRIEEGLSCTP